MSDSQRINLMEAGATVSSVPVTAPQQRSTLADLLLATPAGRRRRGDTRGYMLRRILVAVDVLALLCAFSVAELAVGLIYRSDRNVLAHDVVLLAIAIPVWIAFARAHNLYHVDGRRADHSAADELAPILWMTTLWSWSILLVGALTGARTVSVTKLVAFWFATVFFLLTLRSIARAWSRRQPWYKQKTILIVGKLEEAATMLPKMLRHPEYGIDVLACVQLPEIDPAYGDGYPAEIGHVPVLSGEVEIRGLIDQLEIDRAIFGSSSHRLDGFKNLLSELREFDLHVDMVPSWYDVVGSRMDLHELEGMPMIAIPNLKLPRSSLFCKRALDLVGASVALVLLLPFMVLCALAIRLDSPGPVLFRQRRVGRDDQRFELLKFRSMRANADELKPALAPLNLHGGGTGSGMFKIDGDPRITRAGKALRRFSLDELPQLINVIRGDMSLVGPRPLIENEDSQIAGRHRQRITLTPGLTGLWQVSGRSNIPFEGMIDLDYLYVTNWSLWGDIKLMMRTVAAVARGQGAY